LLEYFLSMLSAVIIGVAVNLIALKVWEWYKRPILIVEPVSGFAKQTLPNGKVRAFYHLNVRNKGRTVAKNVRAMLTFFKNGKWVCGFPAKWDFRPEPLKLELKGNTVLQIPQPSLMPQAELIDISPTPKRDRKGQSFCKIMKYDNENECYGFNAFSYLYSGLKNQAWRLGKGKYKVKVELYGDNVSKVDWFIVENCGKNLNDVKISKAQ